MKRGILAALLLLCGMGTALAAAPAAPLDAFKGQKGVIDIAGGTAHIPDKTGRRPGKSNGGNGIKENKSLKAADAAKDIGRSTNPQFFSKTLNILP